MDDCSRGKREKELRFFSSASLSLSFHEKLPLLCILLSCHDSEAKSELIFCWLPTPRACMHACPDLKTWENWFKKNEKKRGNFVKMYGTNELQYSHAENQGKKEEEFKRKVQASVN